MPFTPLHLGPGAAFKAIGGSRFSFMVFGGSQVLIDIEPGYRMLNGDSVLHGPSHTLVGALSIGVVAALIGKPVSEAALRLLRFAHTEVSWIASSAGALIGTFSHVFLDAIMHADMSPWRPFVESNRLLGIVSLPTLHLLCVVSGLAGVSILAIRYARKERIGVGSD